jgi:hypothetical protein
MIERPAVRIVREPRLAEQTVFVGGLPGCGKTMMSPIVTSLARVEIQKFNEILEHVCALRLLGSLDEAAATTMIRMLTDLDLYRLTMSREVNMRVSDLSSIFKNPGTWRYLRRLVGPGDAAAVERIRGERPILNITMHNALAISPPLFAALGSGARILELVRHPLYMIRQWRLYVERYGTDPRDFTLWFEHEGRAVPFFAYGWEARYLAANPMDRVIYAIEHLLEMGCRALADLPEAQKSQVLIVPFERFVLDPWPYLRELETLLDTEVTPTTRRELKRQRVPRKRIADGVALPIYKHYGWEPPHQGADERRELENRRQFVVQEASVEALVVLDRLSTEYEAAYMKGDIL